MLWVQFRFGNYSYHDQVKMERASFDYSNDRVWSLLFLYFNLRLHSGRWEVLWQLRQLGNSSQICTNWPDGGSHVSVRCSCVLIEYATFCRGRCISSSQARKSCKWGLFGRFFISVDWVIPNSFSYFSVSDTLRQTYLNQVNSIILSTLSPNAEKDIANFI